MSEPNESDIAFAKKIAPDLARGMQTYDEYIARGEELGALARAYKRKWDNLLAGIAAYREEIEARLAPAPAQSRKDSDGSLSWCNCERCQANRDHSAPAQSKEEEALALVGQLGSIAYKANMHIPSGYAEMLKEMEAALRSRQSPQVAISPSRLAWKIGNAVMGYLWPDEDDDGLAPSPEGIRAAIKNAVHDVLVAAPQPSPAADCADGYPKCGELQDSRCKNYCIPGTEDCEETSEAAAPQPSPQGEDTFSEAVGWIVELQDKCACSMNEDDRFLDVKKAAKMLLERETALRARLASAQSSAQGEEAREEAINAFRMDELDAVMLSVDKWFDESDPRLKNNPATRAADAREIALRAIEKEVEARAALERNTKE